jgi:hypothetical protein
MSLLTARQHAEGKRTVAALHAFRGHRSTSRDTIVESIAALRDPATGKLWVGRGCTHRDLVLRAAADLHVDMDIACRRFVAGYVTADHGFAVRGDGRLGPWE